MEFTKRKTIVLFALLLYTASLSAQKRIMVYKTDISEFKAGISSDVNDLNEQNIRNVADQIVSFYTNDERFVVIDRAKYDLIKNEQELQKSEEFIDGYVVEQGKQEGADYIFYTKYLRKQKALYLRVYDVTNGKVYCENTEEFDLLLGIIKDAREKVYQLLNKINNECFSISFHVVRSLDKKEGAKTKSLLIAMGHNQKIKLNHELEIFRTVVENIGNKEMERDEVIGEGKIDKIEDANFSQIKVTKGGEAIAEYLQAGEPLYCRVKTN